MEYRALQFLIIIFFLITGCSSQKLPDVNNLKQEKTVEIETVFTGDLLFETPLYNDIPDYNFENYFSEVKPYLTGDLILGNMEVVLGGEDLGIAGDNYRFNGPFELANQLKQVGFNYFTLANNHSNDRGHQGIINTLKCLDDYQILNSGMSSSLQDRNQVHIVNIKGVNIAILAYTYATNQTITSDYSYTIPVFLDQNGEFNSEKKEMIKNDVNKAQQMADVVIVAMHWGKEFTNQIINTQKEAAIFLNELNVDIVIGNHSHNLQSAQTLVNNQGKETFIIYSLGNFVSADGIVSRANEHFKNMYQIGGILKLTLEYDFDLKKASIKTPILIPVVNHYDKNYTNFKLIPLKNYLPEQASNHYRSQFSDHFNAEQIKKDIQNIYNNTINIDMEDV